MEIMRQERSKKDAEDDLKLRNIKSLLKKLMNKKGLGGYIFKELFEKFRIPSIYTLNITHQSQFSVYFPETLVIFSTGQASKAVPECLGRSLKIQK